MLPSISSKRPLPPANNLTHKPVSITTVKQGRSSTPHFMTRHLQTSFNAFASYQCGVAVCSRRCCYCVFEGCTCFQWIQLMSFKTRTVIISESLEERIQPAVLYINISVYQDLRSLWSARDNGATHVPKVYRNWTKPEAMWSVITLLIHRHACA